jgi:hypothetical protein
MHPSGRPREFTPDMQVELLNLVAQGASIEQAAHIVGISHRTVQREAKADDGFQLELERALGAAPVDPEQLMQQAARTHWRAAAWMLERAQPERYGKRPPRSCSPEKLRDIVNHIIERALEATPAKHRAAVYQHVRSEADQACAAFLPEQNDSTRWVQSLATRPTPLSDEEDDKSEGAPRQLDDEQSELNEPARDLPPDGGIMSPKMHFATEAESPEPAGPVVKEPAAPEPALSETATSDPGALEPASSEMDANESAAARPPKRLTGRQAKALHIQTRDEARRARRQASREKRKGRKAA